MAHVVCRAGKEGRKKKKKRLKIKSPSFLSKHQECEQGQRNPIIFSMLVLRGSATPGGHRPPCSGEPLAAGPGGARRAVPYATVPALPHRPDPAADKAPGNCSWMGFGGPLCTRLCFPSDRTTAKFDFVHSEGSLDLCSLPVCK